MANELWKDIPGYEGFYQSSTLGRIRSLDRVIMTVRGPARLRGRVLKPGVYCKSGHVSVVLGHGANGSPVHQLVALTFLGACPPEMEVRHIDGNPQNNSIDNLCYGSRSDNILDVYRQGKRWRKLSLEEIRAIYEAPADITATDLAEKYKISVTCVSRIRRGAYKSCRI